MKTATLTVAGFAPVVMPEDVIESITGEITLAREASDLRALKTSEALNAESVMIQRSVVLYRIVRGDLRAMRKTADGVEMTEDAAVRAYFGPAFKGSPSEWIRVGECAHAGALPCSIADRGIKASVRWARERSSIIAEAIHAAVDDGMDPKVAKAAVPSMIAPALKTAESRVVESLADGSGNAESIITGAIVEAFPGSKAAKDAKAAADRRAESRRASESTPAESRSRIVDHAGNARDSIAGGFADHPDDPDRFARLLASVAVPAIGSAYAAVMLAAMIERAAEDDPAIIKTIAAIRKRWQPEA